ncbi:MAG: tetratricopeptide repeat protein [Burkholderiales bacterium]
MSADAESARELPRAAARLRQSARYDEAERTLLRALELEHDFAPAHFELGMTYSDQAHFEEAADYFQLAVHFKPDLIAAWLQLGATLVRLGRADAAQAAYRETLAREPTHGGAWRDLGNLLKAGGDWNAAIDCYTSAAACDPASADVHSRLGYALYQVGRYAASTASFERALALQPDMVEARHNLGLLLLETGQPEEALRSFEQALAGNPAIVETRACVAHALRDLGRLDAAIERYDEVLATHPDFTDALNNRTYALLMKEEYAAGWPAYECRFTNGGLAARDFPYPQWQGESLAGKRILVYAEQGLGDEIMFASCLPDLLESAGHCVIECNTRLAKLFQRSFPRAHVYGAAKHDDKNWLAKLPRVDCQTAIGSLPHHFRRARPDFPPHHGYLSADNRRVAHWRQQLAAAPAVRVGIAWRGGMLRSRQTVRSIGLPQWLPLLRSSGVEFYALQYGDIAAELAALRVESGTAPASLGSAVDDLDELAAIVTTLDLIISVDNTVAHLAGALGRPVWTLLPASPEWRYPRHGDAMPWYPSMRLFHRARGETWQPVLERVCAELCRVERG